MVRRNLANLDRDMFQGTQRILQEAMAHGILNDLIFGGLEAGQSSVQALYATPVATQNCRVETRRVTWDGRVFRYAQALATLNTDLLAQSDSHVQDVAYAAIQANGDAGATSFTVTVGGSDGDGSGNIAANALAYGSAIIFRGSENSINIQITGNTVVSGGGTMTVTVREELPALTTSMSCELMANPYIGVRASTGGDLYKSFVGLPTMPATSTLKWHWEQTWGPCWIAPANGYGVHNVGSQARSNQVVARYNGTIMVHDDTDVESEYQQHIGFVMSRSQGNGQGAPFIMLQIAP